MNYDDANAFLAKAITDNSKELKEQKLMLKAQKKFPRTFLRISKKILRMSKLGNYIISIPVNRNPYLNVLIKDKFKYMGYSVNEYESGVIWIKWECPKHTNTQPNPPKSGSNINHKDNEYLCATKSKLLVEIPVRDGDYFDTLSDFVINHPEIVITKTEIISVPVNNRKVGFVLQIFGKEI